MEKSYMSMFLLLIAISCALAKDAGKKDTKETTAKPKLPQTLSRGKALPGRCREGVGT